MSNNKEVKTVPKGIEISADKLMNVVLDRSISDKDQTLGAYKQTIKHLEAQNTELKKELVAEQNKPVETVDDQKVMVITNAKSNTKECPRCGYTNNINAIDCWDCGTSLKTVKIEPQIIEYRNLDKIIEDIRKEEAKSLKVDNVELEKKLDSTEFRLNKITNTLKNVENIQAQDLTDAKRDVRERYQKEMKEIEKSLEKVKRVLKKL
jgi:ribosomal protein L40E